MIQDLEQFYERPGETYVRRAAEMFSADPVPRPGNADQFADGGGPAFIPSVFTNPLQAEREAEGADLRRTAAHRPHHGTAAHEPGARPQADAHPRGRPRL